MHLRARHFRSFGVPFSITCDAAVADVLETRLPDLLPYRTEAAEATSVTDARFHVSGPNADGCCNIDHEGQDPAQFPSLDAALADLATRLMVHVAERSPRFVFVHAGVVEQGGRAILLPGTSFAGKTTLTAALVRAGATYYSDEYALLNSDGQVHPYARELQMRAPGSREQSPVGVEQLGGAAGASAVRVAQVLFAQYRPLATWRPMQVSRGMAALAMMRHTIPVQRDPGRVMATLAATLQTATCWEGERGEAHDTAAAILLALDHA